MRPELEERIAYGRAVRERAVCLMAAHGVDAGPMAHAAATDPALPMAHRLFFEAVERRIERIAAAPRRSRARVWAEAVSRRPRPATGVWAFG